MRNKDCSLGYETFGTSDNRSFLRAMQTFVEMNEIATSIVLGPILFRTECRGIPNVGHIGVECSSRVTDAVANISAMELMRMTCANSLSENMKRSFGGFRRCDNSQMRDFAFAFRSEREQVINCNFSVI